jgi:hypothetical protein
MRLARIKELSAATKSNADSNGPDPCGKELVSVAADLSSCTIAVAIEIGCGSLACGVKLEKCASIRVNLLAAPDLWLCVCLPEASTSPFTRVNFPLRMTLGISLVNLLWKIIY